MKRWWLIAACVLLSGGAWAKDDEPKSHFAAGMSYGQVYFDDELYQEAFNHDYLNGGVAHLAWYPVRRLSLTGSAGTFYDTGKAAGITTGRASGEDMEFYVLPLQLSLGYRFDFLREQLFVPSLHAGGDYWLFQEYNDFVDDERGGKAGWHTGGGLGILLDRLDPEASFNLFQDFGVENTFLELTADRVAMPADGLDFSGWVFQGGLLFEF